MGCCNSKPQLSNRDGPSFSLPSAPPQQWTNNFRRQRGLSSQSATAGVSVPTPSRRTPVGHSHSLDVGTPGNDSRMPATGRSVSVNDDGLGMAVNSSEVFVPKVGSSLIFQESTSQDVLCVDTRSPECKCVVSSTRSAAIFKVASVATHEKNGDLVALQCTSLRKGAAAAAAGTAAGKGTHTSGADDGSLLYFSDINQKLHCRSADRTPLWQLVELRDDVVNGRRAQEATYVLRVVAQWWFPAVILRRCNPPSDAVFLDSAGRERLYSVNYTGSGSDTTTSLGANTNANANAAAAAGNMGGAAQTSSGTAAPVEDSPATAAFNRLQNNVDNGFSSSFEASFAESDEARQVVDDSGEVFFAVRFRSGAVEAVPVAALCTAAQLQARSRRQEPSEATDTAASWPTSFAPNDEVFVGPPYFDGLGQFVCRVEDPRTPSKQTKSGNNESDDDGDDDDDFMAGSAPTLRTPLLLSGGKAHPRREAELTLTPDMHKALRWNLMIS